MTRPSKTMRMVSVAVAMSLMAAPTIASAASSVAPASQAVSPLVALSFLASDTSRAALCGVAATNAATTAATTTGTTAAASTGGTTTGTTAQGVPPQGCVLPAVDVAVPVAEAPMVVPRSGFSLLGPLAAVLAGLVAILVLANVFDDDDKPVSPA